MEGLLRRGLNTWQSVAGENSGLERFLRRQYSKALSWREKRFSGKNYTIFWNGNPEAKRVGIYMQGGCDLPSIFAAVPQMQGAMRGTACLIRHGAVADSRTDILLQALQQWPEDVLQPVIDKLELAPDYFKPRLFEPTFEVQGPNGPETFDKNIILFSVGPDVVRAAYRHREHGFIVDPGGFWLSQSMGKVLSDLSAAHWFRQNFVSIGHSRVDDFVNHTAKIITELRQRTQAQIVMLNVLVTEPGTLTHNYQFVKNSYEIRRREFNLALLDLSRQMNFPFIDVDRALKRAGLSDTQMDFAHYPDEVYPYIAREAFQVFQEIGALA